LGDLIKRAADLAAINLKIPRKGNTTVKIKTNVKAGQDGWNVAKNGEAA